MRNEHYGLFSSTIFDEADEKGIITTTTCPQTFKFVNKEKTIGYVVDVIEIVPDATSIGDIKIQYNDDVSYMYVAKGDTEYQDSFDIYSITCLSPIGSKFKFKGQIKRNYIIDTL